MMLFCKFLVTAVPISILFPYCFSNCDFVGTWEHFLMFPGFKNLFVGSLHSKPQHRLEYFSRDGLDLQKYSQSANYLCPA